MLFRDFYKLSVYRNLKNLFLEQILIEDFAEKFRKTVLRNLSYIQIPKAKKIKVEAQYNKAIDLGLTTRMFSTKEELKKWKKKFSLFYRYGSLWLFSLKNGSHKNICFVKTMAFWFEN